MPIRLAVPDDARTIHELHKASVTELCTLYSREMIEGWLKGRSPEGYTGIAKKEMYVFEDQGEIFGFSHVVPGEIVALFVAPGSAGKGIGTRLMMHALPIARKDWGGPVQLEATLNAVPFYKTLGFRKIRETTARRNDVDLPLVEMEM